MTGQGKAEDGRGGEGKQGRAERGEQGRAKRGGEGRSGQKRALTPLGGLGTPERGHRVLSQFYF